MGNNIIICHISFNHSAFDDRIYWKELLGLKKAGYTTIHISVDTKDNDFISEEGIRIITVRRKKLSGHPSINKALQFLFQKKGTINDIFEKARNLKAAIYHFHDLQITALAKRLKTLPHQPRIIYDAHEAYHLLMLENTPQTGIRKILYRTYVQLVAKWELKNASHCDEIIVTDNYTLNYFRKNLPQKKVSIIFNYSFFLPSIDDDNKQKQYDLIYTGLFAKGRGIEEIVRTISYLKQTKPVKLLLIGTFENSSLKEEILGLIEELRIKENICLKDFVPFKQIADYYKQAKIGLGLFHKTPKYFTFIPIKLFEYMAFGLPVIFSNHGPSAEIVKKENCGVLIDYKSIENIAESIRLILNDDDLYIRLSENGKTAVRERYNWNAEKNKLLTIYEQQLNPPAKTNID